MTAYWDDMHNLIPHMRQRGLTEGIDVTTRYQDLAGEYYETTWKLNPFIYSDTRWVYHRGIADLVEAVEKLSGDRANSPGRYQLENPTQPRSKRSEDAQENGYHEESMEEGGFREGSGG